MYVIMEMELDKIQIFFLLVVLLSFLSCDKVNNYNHGVNNLVHADSIQTIDNSAYSGNVLFGIPVDSYNVENGKVKNNQFISTVFENYGITGEQIHQILSENKETFDPRQFKKGSNYSVFISKDTLARADYFIYDHDDFVKYVFSFKDSLRINRHNAEIRTEMRFSSGIINTSLWDAAMENGLNPNLTAELNDIYQWTIDFFGLQRGDKFKVVYEEQYINDKSVGITNIFAALFEHSGASIYAIPFTQDNNISYYAIDGVNLKKSFLKAPLRFSRISSRFSNARRHPILKIVRPHHGIDYAAPIGTPVQSIGDGRVIEATYQSGAGRMVKIRHNSVYTTAYLHLSRFEKGITPGAYVSQGQIIGYVGSTGLSTGPHLDFRFYRNGSPVDPLKVEAPSADPVSEENFARFEMVKTTALSLLETID